MATINPVGNGLTGATGTGSFVGSNSPTITTPVLFVVNDSNGNEVFRFNNVASAVNYIGTQNVVTTGSPILEALGDDTNIIMVIRGKGTGGVEVEGTATNDNASAGYVGEVVSSEVLAASPVTVNDVTSTNLTSISLTAGDWDVWGNVHLTGNTMVNIVGWISTTSATIPDAAYYSLQNLVGLGTADWAACTPYKRMSLNSTTTVYLSAYQDGTGAANGYGTIYARRAR